MQWQAQRRKRYALRKRCNAEAIGEADAASAAASAGGTEVSAAAFADEHQVCRGPVPPHASICHYARRISRKIALLIYTCPPDPVNNCEHTKDH